MKQNFTVRQGALDCAEAFLSVARHRSFRRAAADLDPDVAPGGGAYYLHPFETAAASFAITPTAAPVRNPDEIIGQPPSGLIVTAHYFVSSQRELIVALAARHRVPAIYS